MHTHEKKDSERHYFWVKQVEEDLEEDRYSRPREYALGLREESHLKAMWLASYPRFARLPETTRTSRRGQERSWLSLKRVSELKERHNKHNHSQDRANAL